MQCQVNIVFNLHVIFVISPDQNFEKHLHNLHSQGMLMYVLKMTDYKAVKQTRP